jgi:uncharacterized protein DUF4340
VSVRKLLLLTAVVAVLFGFIYFFERKMPSTSDRERKGELHWDLPEDRIEGLSLTRGPEQLEFQKTAAAPWRMVKPAPYPADAFAISSVTSELADLKRSGGDPGEARPADYGLEKPEAKATIVWTEPDAPGEKKSRTVEFGLAIPGTETVAARVEGSEKVLFVPASTLAAVRKNADDFRSRDVFGGTPSEISRLEILRGRSRLVLERRDGGWWIVEPTADLADAAEVERLAGQLTSARVGDFVHGNDDLAALGLNPPLYRVTVSRTGGETTAVDFGATRSDGNNMYARRDGQVFTVDRELGDDLSREAEPFRSAPLTTFERSDVTALEASFGDKTFALAQKDGGWTAQGRPVLAPAADDVLSGILDLKSRSFVEETRVGELAAPEATVTVRRKTGLPWILSFHPRGVGMIARVSQRPGGFIVDPDAVRKLRSAIEKVVGPPVTPAKKRSG